MFDSLFAGLNSLDISDMDLQSDAEKRHLHAALPCISVDNASYLVDSNCEMSMCNSTAQARTKFGSRSWFAALYLTLVTCPCAFRLSRLAQSVGRGLGIHLLSVFPANSRIKLLF